MGALGSCRCYKNAIIKYLRASDTRTPRRRQICTFARDPRRVCTSQCTKKPWRRPRRRRNPNSACDMSAQRGARRLWTTTRLWVFLFLTILLCAAVVEAANERNFVVHLDGAGKKLARPPSGANKRNLRGDVIVQSADIKQVEYSTSPSSATKWYGVATPNTWFGTLQSTASQYY